MSTPKPDLHDDVLRWVEGYAARLLRDDLLIVLEDRLLQQLLADIPEVAADPGIRRDLRASTHDLLSTFLGEAAKDPAAEMVFPPAALDLARTLAKRRHDVSVLLRMYRVGQRVFWRELMRIVIEEIADADLRMAALEFLWDQMSRALERNIDVLVSVHTEESEKWLRGALVRRTETVHAILRGEPMDTDQASVQLGHNLRLWQSGMVLWAADELEDSDPSGKLEALAGEIAAALGAATPLTVQSSARVVWAWMATGREPQQGRIAGVPSLRRVPGLRVAVGVPAREVAGFRDSHRDAIRAQAVAVRGGEQAPVTAYRDVEVVSCLSADSDAMRALVAREVGGLGGTDPADARLRETVLAYLTAGGSARAAAAALRVHKNTVLYRLKQAEELLGRAIDERRLPLELALLLVDTYGERVLPGAEG